MVKKDSDFYKRMLEAKERKKKHLEQARLAAEFQVYPERFIAPVVKSEAEVKLDKAFAQIQIRLGTGPISETQKALDHLKDKTQGL